MQTPTSHDPPAQAGPRVVVLVEGRSDQLALETLARRRGRDLDRERVHVMAMGGATNIGHYMDRYGPRGLGVEIAGLYDSPEERFVRQALIRAGRADRAAQLPGSTLEDHGFFACTVDLEDELIRAIGAENVEQLVEAEGEIASFRRLQRQLAHRDSSLHDQLHRLMSGRSGGKYRYARIIAEAVDLARIPHPLAKLLDYTRPEAPPACPSP